MTQLRGEPPSDLTPRQLEALKVYLRTGNSKAAAHEMGIAIGTFRNLLTEAYNRLDVNSGIAAAHHLGWIRIP